MTERFQGTESLAPDGYLQPTRTKATYQCLRCGHTYSRIYVTLPKTDPKCPRKVCQTNAMREQILREQDNMARIIEEQHPPGHIGANNTVRAIDETARIVMEDHKMTDLKTGVRTGDSVAPTLPSPMQRQVDSFFDPKSALKGTRGQKQMDMLGRRAMAGAFRGMAVNPGNLISGKAGESGLTMVGKESLK